MFKNKSKFLSSIAITAFGFLGIVFFQKSYYNNSLAIDKNTNYQKQEQQLKAEANLHKNLPSFGFGNLSADWTYLKYIQYFGDTEARDETGYSVVTDYFETIVNKDPKFIQANLALSATNSLFAGKPQKTVALLDKSIKSLSPDMENYPFMVLAYKAVDEILFLGDLKAAKKSYTKAAQWAEENNSETGDKVAKLYQNTVNFLATNPDPTITQVSGWSMILERNNDPKVRKYAMQKIRDLGGEVIINADGEITIKPPKKDV